MFLFSWNWMTYDLEHHFSDFRQYFDSESNRNSYCETDSLNYLICLEWFLCMKHPCMYCDVCTYTWSLFRNLTLLILLIFQLWGSWIRTISLPKKFWINVLHQPTVICSTKMTPEALTFTVGGVRLMIRSIINSTVFRWHNLKFLWAAK